MGATVAVGENDVVEQTEKVIHIPKVTKKKRKHVEAPIDKPTLVRCEGEPSVEPSEDPKPKKPKRKPPKEWTDATVEDYVRSMHSKKRAFNFITRGIPHRFKDTEEKKDKLKQLYHSL